MSPEAVKNREKMRKAREATGAREVKTGRVPRWARLAIARAVREHPKHYHSRLSRGVSHHAAMYTCLNCRGPSGGNLFDHVGESMGALVSYDGPTLVSEPYEYEGVERDARAFASWVGCDVVVGGPSWHYPGWTVRVEFYPRRDEVAP